MRSKLFVPGSRPELFEKALASQADGLSFDLEDAVEESRKAEARATLAGFLDTVGGRTGKILVVRVNGIATPHFDADIDALARPGLTWLNIPKVEDPAVVALVASRLERLEASRGITRPIGILANIESPAGLRRVHEIATAHARLVGLQIGFGDLLTPLGMARDPAIMAHTRIRVRLAAAEADIPAFDSAFVDVADRQGYEADARAARALGFAGKSCIHPAQIETANRVFAPTESEIADALAVIGAAEKATGDGIGAFMLDGRMVDLPFIRRAEAVLAEARRLGLTS